MNNTKSEKLIISFEWHSILRDILKNIWIVVLAILIGIMAVYCAQKTVYSPEYTSSATLVVRSKNTGYSSFSTLSASKEMATIYSQVFIQPAMKQLVAEQIGRSSFKGRISANVLQETNLMTISVTTASPELSYKELCAVLEVYPTISENIFDNSVIDIIKAPNMPRGPSNNMTTQKKGMVVGLCALLALAGIIVLSLLRDTVKSEKEFKEKIDSKLIGTIPYEKLRYKGTKKRKMLINDTTSSLRFIESFQKLATKLEYMNKREGSKVILFTSVASNESKTTTAINTAMALAARGHKVALLDMDFMKPSIFHRLEVAISSKSDLAVLLDGKVQFADYQFVKYRNGSLYLGLSRKKRPNYQKWLEEGSVGKCIEEIKEGVDYVIIDPSPMSVSADVSHLTKIADKTILVTKTDRVRTPDINEAILSLKDYGGTLAGCVLTYVHRELTFFGMEGADESKYQGHYGYFSNSSRGSGYSHYGQYGYNGRSLGALKEFIDDEELKESDRKVR